MSALSVSRSSADFMRLTYAARVEMAVVVAVAAAAADSWRNSLL